MEETKIPDKVLEWSSRFTGETTSFDEKSYYWTEPVKKALFRLSQYNGYLIGIVGLIGTGKTFAIDALSWKLEQKIQNKEITFPGGAKKDIYCFRWGEKFWDIVKEDVTQSEYWRDEYEDRIKFAYAYTPSGRKMLEGLKFHRRIPFSIAEDELPDKKLNEIRERLAIEFLAAKGYVLFIDTPDYSRKGSWMITRDLTDIYKLWTKIIEQGAVTKPNIVICLQKELVMAHPHFFLGKMDKIVLDPLTPGQLLKAYKQIFDTYEPFTEDSLRYVAELSRGVFRRFKKYIRLCLEPYVVVNRSNPITRNEIDKYVSPEILAGDLDLELSEIFRAKTQRQQAFSILNIVRGKQPINQKQIAKALNIHASLLGKMIRKLEMYGYLKTSRGKGRELLVEVQ